MKSRRRPNQAGESAKMITGDGWYGESERHLSPNFDSRPAGETIDLLVIHNISLPPDQYGGGFVHQLFANTLRQQDHPYFAGIAGLRVSSHLFIERSGKITQFVPFAARAWHAGESSFGGRTGCNDFSIGIELEGTDIEPYTAAQYGQLVLATCAIMDAYPAITRQRIVGHSDIAPGRKTDPGIAFDWHRYFNMLKQEGG